MPSKFHLLRSLAGSFMLFKVVNSRNTIQSSPHKPHYIRRCSCSFYDASSIDNRQKTKFEEIRALNRLNFVESFVPSFFFATFFSISDNKFVRFLSMTFHFVCYQERKTLSVGWILDRDANRLYFVVIRYHLIHTFRSAFRFVPAKETRTQFFGSLSPARVKSFFVKHAK